MQADSLNWCKEDLSTQICFSYSEAVISGAEKTCRETESAENMRKNYLTTGLCTNLLPNC